MNIIDTYVTKLLVTLWITDSIFATKSNYKGTMLATVIILCYFVSQLILFEAKTCSVLHAVIKRSKKHCNVVKITCMPP